MTDRYNPFEIERKWRARWEADGLYKTTEDPSRSKWYALTMFPYTSGDLHVGHWYNYVPPDVHARYKRMQGHNVLFPIGFDAFGLPAENAAIQRGLHPYKWTMDSIARMREQLKSIGGAYDWSREVITCVPEYYKWTEWFFLQFYKAGLAYCAEAPANWCPRCQTVLANEQVTADGTCERCGAAVTKRDLPQWLFRITKYADELLEFRDIEWPERIKAMQRNWIGRSEGTEISFDLSHEGLDEKEIRVFTTRADTVYGVTFMVLAPEHPLVPKITSPEQRAEVTAYIEAARRQTEIERMSAEREKHGVFTGAYCVNRLNGRQAPIWIADYVLMGYGTGAVMAVPAHDERDFAFARRYGLPIPVVIAPPDWEGSELEEAYIDEGRMVNSGPFDGAPNQEGKEAVTRYLEEHGWGKHAVSYRLRDWLISRQRYWGAPIPIVYCGKCGAVPVPEEQLPVLLPEDAEFRPTGESPLKYHEGFVNTTCPQCGGPARRETDTMDTFICSSWYHMRYASPRETALPMSKEKAAYWLPVDQYMGGAEHATMHLLYARFFWKACRDLGIVQGDEPFLRLFNQGIILGEDHEKMSKSRGNVVNPDELVNTLGSDAVRAFLMFIGPWEQGGAWSSSGIQGISRWLHRVWNLALETPPDTLPEAAADPQAEKELRRMTHKTVKRVLEDIERFRFNTMLAALMEFTNYLGHIEDKTSVGGAAWREAVDSLLLLLAPSVPHIAEELWERTGHAYSIHTQRLPEWDESLTAEDTFELVIQVNGKLRDKITVPVGIDEARAKELALASPRVQAHTSGQQVRKVLYVPGRLVNIVAA